MSDRIGVVSYYILDYLSDNPDAGDTFEGICEWWVLKECIKFEIPTVSEALDRLVAEGFIEEQKLPNSSSSFFKIKHTEENTQRIQAWVREIGCSLRN